MTAIVRRATLDDVPALVAAAALLLAELRHVPEVPPPVGADEVCRGIIAGAIPGALWVACDPGGKLVGFVSISVQQAMRVGGRYALIQELWVDRAHRSRRIGDALIAAVVAGCRELDLTKIEVGLPGSSSPEHAQVVRFYHRVGFTEVGPRFRRVLS